jgi:S-adenosylmethionine:tRNA ribosyltransferase-isomerase
LTLHVGYGTFRPIMTENVADHRLEPEEFDFPEESAALLNRTRAEGGRVVAVGTTCTRVLESQYRDGAYQPGQGRTGHYIYPPYTFRAVDALQTNFHLPKSSLLALVCAFAGKEFTLEAYRYAVKEEFRFYSYGDVMLIL